MDADVTDCAQCDGEPVDTVLQSPDLIPLILQHSKTVDCPGRVCSAWAVCWVQQRFPRLEGQVRMGKSSARRLAACRKLVAIITAGSSTEEDREEAAHSVHTLAYESRNVGSLVEAGCIDGLVALVREGKTEQQREFAATALGNFACDHEHCNNKPAIGEAGGVEALVIMLQEGTEWQKEECAHPLPRAYTHARISHTWRPAAYWRPPPAAPRSSPLNPERRCAALRGRCDR